MMINVAIAFALIFGGMIGASTMSGDNDRTPVNWTPQSHRKQMIMCRAMCKETGVREYDAFTGECKCRRKR